MHREISQAYQPISLAQISALLADVLPMYWESQMTTQDFSRQYAIWYEVLKGYSNATVSRVAMDWVKNAKRKPTPADFLELCQEIDSMPRRLERLSYLASLPEQIVYRSDGKMNGCPIELSKMMRFSRNNQISFPEYEQLDYLKTGIIPDWYVPVSVETKGDGMPSREELLAGMSPEVRVVAVRADDDWRH